jgi:uncharacterized protein YkwD
LPDIEVIVERWAHKFLLAPLLGILLLSAGAFTNPMPLARSEPPASDDARQLLDQVNRERAEAGLPALLWDARLAAAAQKHAEAMAKLGTLSHQLPGEPPLEQRLAEAPLDHSGENVGFGPGVASLHNGFMNSPPHRANILGTTFNAVGIGLARKGTDCWATEDFAHLISEVSHQTAVDQVVRAFNEERAKAGQQPLRRIITGRLTAPTCAMGEDGRPDSSAVLKLPGARYALVYSTADPSRLPANAAGTVRARDVDSYAVGVCFARSERFPGGMYWVSLATLSSER